MQQNIMGEKPVKTLMLSMGIPFIISLLVQGLYNIVDSAFLANMATGGAEAVNALTLASPMQIVLISLGEGTGMGANAFLSKSLGQGNKERASKIAGNTIVLGVFLYIIFVLFGIFGVRPYIETQSSNPEIIEMAVSYLTICSMFAFGTIYFALFEKLLQSMGHPICSTISQITGAVVNIILDPIMIYGLLGCPEMGVEGAAYATVIGQAVSGILGLVFYIKYAKEINKSPKYFLLSGKIIKEIYKIGAPAILMQGMSAVMTYGLNLIFVAVNEALVTAYGIIYRIQQIVLFAIFGLRDAVTPIVSFNHGKRDSRRMKEGVKYGIIYTAAIALIGTAVIEIFAVPITQAFGLTGITAQYCISGLRILAISLVFAGTNICLQGVFQALNGGLQSLVITILRQLLLVLPIAYLFAQLTINDSSLAWTIWLTFIIAEVVTCAVAVFMYIRIRRKTIEVPACLPITAD